MEHVSDLYLDGPCGLQADLGFFRGPDERPYRILALHCNQTYAFSSLLYGIPRPEQNAEALATIREYCAKLGPHADCDFSSLRCVYFFDRFVPAALMEEIERRTLALQWEELAHAWNP